MRVLPAVVVVGVLTSVTSPLRADDLETLAHAIELSPEDSRTYDAYAAAALKAKRWDDAIHYLKIAVARLPDYSEGYYKLAYAYRQKKEWADAADYYRRYVVLNPGRTDTYYGLGAALEGVGDKKGAIAAFEKYVSLEKSPEKRKFVGQARAELAKLDPGRAAAAETPSESASGRPMGWSEGVDKASLRARADELRKAGKMAEAATAYRRAIEADRRNLELYNDLGNVYFS